MYKLPLQLWCIVVKGGVCFPVFLLILSTTELLSSFTIMFSPEFTFYFFAFSFLWLFLIQFPSRILNKKRWFLNEFGNPFFSAGFSLSLVSSVFFFFFQFCTSFSFSNTRHSAESSSHLCVFNNCPSVDSFLLNNFTFPYKSLQHHPREMTEKTKIMSLLFSDCIYLQHAN